MDVTAKVRASAKRLGNAIDEWQRKFGEVDSRRAQHQGGDMTDITLPPLPRFTRMANLPGTDEYECAPVFTEEQMRAYATAAVLAERERCARIVEDTVRMVDAADALHMIRSGVNP